MTDFLENDPYLTEALGIAIYLSLSTATKKKKKERSLSCPPIVHLPPFNSCH
jgi:hypothetical protein